MRREIIQIDEELCNGCGICVPNCHEGALQIIDGKARLVSELMCDGLGACIGHCPEGAITIEEREAVPYDELAVMSQMIKKGKNTMIAHLGHLKEHGEKEYLSQGVRYLLEHRDLLDFDPDEVLEAVHQQQPPPRQKSHHHHPHEEEGASCGCAGSATRTFAPVAVEAPATGINQHSALTHWPVQLHLINPRAGHFKGSHLLMAADCTAFTLGNFHPSFLKGKTLAIACPKLDSNRESYVQKLSILVDESEIDMMTVMIMEVPCCSGLVQLVEVALSQCERRIPVKVIVVSVEGQILREQWHRVA
jgi:NAD-dependent dihydropyrimidine dehydrogenase PreA subunit